MRLHEFTNEGILDSLQSMFRKLAPGLSAPRGFKPFPGDAVQAYNAFWDTDRMHHDQSSNDYHDAQGIRYERMGDVTVKLVQGRATMAAKFDPDYDDYTRSDRVTVPGSAERMTVYVKS